MKACKNCQQFITTYPLLNMNHPDAKIILAIMDIHDLTVEQLADELGIAKRTVYRWLQERQATIKPMYFELLKLKGYL